MNQNIKKHDNPAKKTLKKDNNSISTARKKRRELSTSSVKQLNRHGGNIVLSFD